MLCTRQGRVLTGHQFIEQQRNAKQGWSVPSHAATRWHRLWHWHSLHTSHPIGIPYPLTIKSICRHFPSSRSLPVSLCFSLSLSLPLSLSLSLSPSYPISVLIQTHIYDHNHSPLTHCYAPILASSIIPPLISISFRPFPTLPAAQTSRISVTALGDTVDTPKVLQLTDLNHVAILGSGTFGRVSLVQDSIKDKYYALKTMLKSEIVLHRQQENVLNEKNVMMCCHHPFIIRLYATFKNERKLYMLLEFVQGGELFAIIHTNKKDGTCVHNGGGMTWPPLF